METPSLEPLACCFIRCLPCGDSHTVIVTTSSDIVHPGGRRRTETGVAGPILSSKVGKRGVCKIPHCYRHRIA